MIVLGLFVALLFIYSLFSKRAQGMIITAPMIFATAGILIVFLQPKLFVGDFDNKAFLIVGEITLALVLFSDATHINLRRVMREYQLPSRLLGVAMPLVMLMGTVFAMLLFTDLSFWEAAVLGVILAPTDASLGLAVITSKRVPAPIREALTLEGGLNDGLAVPFMMLFIALARVDSPLGDTSWVMYAGQQIVLGFLVGLVLGWLGGWLTAQAKKNGWMAKPAQELALLSLAVFSWWLSENVLGGNGFIAAFIAGAVVRRGYESIGEEMVEINEAWAHLLIYLVFYLFGITVAPDLLLLTVPFWMYAIVSLTVVRMLPVWLSMHNTGVQRASKVFMGWFGPRGLASVVLGLVYIKEKAHLPGEQTIILAVIATVLLSIFAHGISAAPGIKLYSRRVASFPSDAPECHAAQSELAEAH
jgi:NhaP-type Na+/H+ or K+/H+ antiporter